MTWYHTFYAVGTGANSGTVNAVQAFDVLTVDTANVSVAVAETQTASVQRVQLTTQTVIRTQTKTKKVSQN